MESKIECSNCHLEIEEGKYQMHQGFCLRYNKYCSVCSIAVLSAEFEEHEKAHQQKEEPVTKSKPPALIPPIQPLKEENNPSEHQLPLPQFNEGSNEVKYRPRPEIKPREIIPPKFDLCEYCASYFENIEDHISKCKVKGVIEKEKAEFAEEFKKMTQNDTKIAMQYHKEEQKKRPNDAELAKKLQMEWDKQNPKPKVKDVDLAKKLQDEWDRLHPKPNDAELAKKLQMEYDKQNPKTKVTDVDLAKKLQDEWNRQHPMPNDAELAQKLHLQYENEYKHQINDLLHPPPKRPQPQPHQQVNPRPVNRTNPKPTQKPSDIKPKHK